MWQGLGRRPEAACWMAGLVPASWLAVWKGGWGRQEEMLTLGKRWTGRLQQVWKPDWRARKVQGERTVEDQGGRPCGRPSPVGCVDCVVDWKVGVAAHQTFSPNYFSTCGSPL